MPSFEDDVFFKKGRPLSSSELRVMSMHSIHSILLCLFLDRWSKEDICVLFFNHFLNGPFLDETCHFGIIIVKIPEIPLMYM